MTSPGAPPPEPPAPSRDVAAASEALVPIVVLVLAGTWWGTFTGGATAFGALAMQAVLIAAGVAGAVVLAGRRSAVAWLDPLGLGRAGRWLLVAWLAAVLLSWWLSPVPRAGRVGVALLPAALVAPAAVARAWRSAAARRWAARGVAATLAGVATAALVLARGGGAPEPALPLGHHNLLVAFLVLLLPLAALPWREGRFAPRLLATVATIGAASAIVAGRPLAGTLALGFEAAAGALLAVRLLPPAPRDAGRSAPRRSAAALGLAALALGAVALWGPRAADLAGGRDASLLARGVYAQAGLAGVAERPAVGWGPGSTAWTLGPHLEPRPGVNPPSELVGELHSLPLALAYETGLPGLLLALGVVVVFARRRLAEIGVLARRQTLAADPPFAAAGLLGLAGAAIAGLATADYRVAALPVAAIVAAGAALAGAAPRRGAGEPETARPTGRWLALVPAVVYVAGAALLLAGPARGHLAHDRAVAALGASDVPAAARHAATAARLDPGFPLYPALAGWLGGAGEAALPLVAAADAAPGVAAFAASAGIHLHGAGRDAAARAALERACRLDPLAAVAPFRLLLVDPDGPRAAGWGARAIAAEPRLAAATFWELRPTLWRRVRERLATEEEIDAGWREELLARSADLPTAGERSWLRTGFDGPGTGSPSLHLFRRRALPREVELPWAEVRLPAAALMRSLPPASSLGTTAATVFSRDCRGIGDDPPSAGS